MLDPLDMVGAEVDILSIAEEVDMSPGIMLDMDEDPLPGIILDVDIEEDPPTFVVLDTPVEDEELVVVSPP